MFGWYKGSDLPYIKFEIKEDKTGQVTCYWPVKQYTEEEGLNLCKEIAGLIAVTINVEILPSVINAINTYANKTKTEKVANTVITLLDQILGKKLKHRPIIHPSEAFNR